MTPWYLVALPALCLFIALLELDFLHVGQWMLSRPVVVGPLLGLACGAPALGVAAGFLFELFSIDVPPVGAAMPLNGAVGASVFVLLSAGPHAIPPAAAFPAGMLLGSLFRRVEAVTRTHRARLSRAAEAALAAEEDVPFGDLILKSLALHAMATLLFLYVGTAAFGPLLDWGWDAAPMHARRGLDLAYAHAPWIGLAGLLHSLRPKG